MTFPHRFVHFTSEPQQLIGILENGLFIRNLRRNVWKYFVRGKGRKEFRDREPQQFGMTCVHAFRFSPNKKYPKRYGRYGIEVTRDWIDRNNFQKVIYLSENDSLHKELQSLFDEAIADLDRRIKITPSDDAFPLMAYTNSRVAATLGAVDWCKFLHYYQYMEPQKHKYQNEWRYAREDPFYQEHSVEELIEAHRTRKGWLHVLHKLEISRTDVVRIFSPKSDEDYLTERFPHSYKDIKVNYT